jgi:outer membrane protein assembly factor BamB
VLWTMRPTRRRFLTALGVGATGLAAGTAALQGADGGARAGGGTWPQPGADAGNTGFVGERGPRTGREQWRHEAPGPGTAPLVAGGLVLPPSARRPLDAATGKPRWRVQPTPTGTAVPGSRRIPYNEVVAVAGDMVFVRGGETLYGLAVADGSREWAHGLPGPNAAVTVADGTAYVWTGNMSQSVIIALRATDGAFRWRYRTDPGVGLPAVSDGTLFLNIEGRVTALAPESGEERWSAAPPPAPPTAAEQASGEDREHGFARSPVVAGGTVYIADTAGRLHARSAAEGRELWRFTPEERPPAAPGESAAGSRPAVADGTVYAGFADGRIRAFDAETGEERWSFRAWNAVTGTPAVTEGMVYIGGRDTMVYALDRVSGERRWEFSTGGGVTGIAVAGGRAYATTRRGVVHALGDGGDA